jgi:hypothetical protein
MDAGVGIAICRRVDWLADADHWFRREGALLYELGEETLRCREAVHTVDGSQRVAIPPR